MKTKIKVFIDVFYFRSALSGIRTYISELESASKKYGSKNIEYIFSHDLNKLSKNQLYLNSNKRLMRLLFQFNYLIWKQFILPIKLLFYKPKYLICPDYISPIFSFKSIKLTVIHDSLFWDYPKNYKSLWRNYFIFLINLGIDKRTHIITTSNYSKKNLSNIIKHSNSIDYIYQSFENVACNKNDFKSNLKLPKKYILHVGSFERRKDLITLFKGFNELKKNNSFSDIKLVLVGAQTVNGDKSTIYQINKFIKENQLTNEVLLLGYVSKEIVLKCYKNASIYVFPSIDEGFGIPILEAFTYSVPVICSDTPIFKEIGGDSVCYFKTRDYFSLSKKIQFLIESKNERENLIKKGNHRIKKFSRKNFIGGYENIILNYHDK